MTKLITAEEAHRVLAKTTEENPIWKGGSVIHQEGSQIGVKGVLAFKLAPLECNSHGRGGRLVKISRSTNL